jgi:hypothetical protein
MDKHGSCVLENETAFISIWSKTTTKSALTSKRYVELEPPSIAIAEILLASQAFRYSTYVHYLSIKSPS